MVNSAPARRYRRAVILLMSGYALILFGVNGYFENGAPSGLSAYIAAALPALPIIGVFLAIGRYLRSEPDEYIRKLEVQKALVATGFALSVATVWGFLESFGMVRHIDSYWVAILWFGGLGLGSCVNALAERGGAT